MDFIIEANHLGEMKEISDMKIKQALERCGGIWETSAKAHAPVDTGRLRNSIEHHAEGDDTMVVETNVEYAIYQEFGTSRQRGTPFVRPSGYENVQTFKTEIEKTLKY